MQVSLVSFTKLSRAGTPILPLIEHARFVYNLQEAETRSEDSDDPEAYRWDSDDSVASSSRRRRHVPKGSKKRMSILTNQHFDIPSYENGFEYAILGKPDTRRRFFQSVARWDARFQKIMIPSPEPPSPEVPHRPSIPIIVSAVEDLPDDQEDSGRGREEPDEENGEGSMDDSDSEMWDGDSDLGMLD